MNGALDQVRSEFIHLAFVAVGGGFSLLSVIVAFLLRRDIQRSDEERAVLREKCESVHGQVEAQSREIGDLRVAVAPLFASAGLPQPEYPAR